MKGKRTILLGLAVTILGALQGVDLVDWTELLGSSEAAGGVVSGIGVAIMILRYVTTTPIFGK